MKSELPTSAKLGGEDQNDAIHFLDYWRVIKSRKEIVFAVFLLCAVASFFITKMMDPIYYAESLIRVNSNDRNAILNSRSDDMVSSFFLSTEFEIIQSSQVLEPVVRNLDLHTKWGKELSTTGAALDVKIAVRMLKNPRNLRIQRYRETNLISIGYFSKRAEEARQVADEIAREYRRYRMQKNEDRASRGRRALTEEFRNQEAAVTAAEDEVERIRKANNIMDIGGATTSDTLIVQRLNNDLINYRIDEISRRKRLEEVQSMGGDIVKASISLMVFDPSLETVIRQIRESELSLVLMLEERGEGHPHVEQMKAGIAALRAQLQDEVDGLIKGLQADHNVAKSKLETLENELEKRRQREIDLMGDAYRDFRIAQRDAYIERSVLEALGARLKQMTVSEGIDFIPVEVVEEAQTPTGPSRPKLRQNVLLGCIVGLLAGIGLAYFIEYLDTSVKTVDDIERHLGLPVIGVIPQKVKLLHQEGVDPGYSEAYRVLRTNLQFANAGHGGGAFAVSSSGVGEGKSTTLFNTAFICASMGDKVLIVDSDMRRPVQHKHLEMSNSFGLTNVLMRDVPIEETIKPTSIPNLHFLPSGKLARNSVGLLDRRRIRELVKNLKARYDIVFFDSPPVIGVSDASIIASEVDGVMLVVQYRKYPRDMSARARRLIENVGGNIVGVVLNNINILRDDYYYYQNSYYADGQDPDSSTPELATSGARDRL